MVMATLTNIRTHIERTIFFTILTVSEMQDSESIWFAVTVFVTIALYACILTIFLWFRAKLAETCVYLG